MVLDFDPQGVGLVATEHREVRVLHEIRHVLGQGEGTIGGDTASECSIVGDDGEISLQGEKEYDLIVDLTIGVAKV